MPFYLIPKIKFFQWHHVFKPTLCELFYMKNFKYLLAIPVVILASQGNASADTIPYSHIGSINPVGYTFTAINTGTIDAYFAGSTAGYNEALGLEVNGVNTGIWGLEDHQTAIGTEMSWNVHAGDTLTFVDYVWGGGGHAATYDSNGQPTGGIYALTSDIAQNIDKNEHVYSTSFDTATGKVASTLRSAITLPAGGTPPVYVAFEDLVSATGQAKTQLGNYTLSNYNYYDENYIFTNVAVKSFPTAPEIDANLAGLGVGLLSGIMLLMLERKRSR